MNLTKNNCIPSKIHGAEFTLTIGCRLNCHYCPQQKLIQRYVDLYGRNNMVMTFDTFKTCLSKIERGSGINFGGMSEAFQNNECAKMVRYAYDLGYKVSMDTTLVGATEEDFERLKDVSFEHLQLHIPDKDNNSKFTITEEYLRIFKLFNDHFVLNGYSCHGKPHDLIVPYLRKEVPLANKMMNRAGNLEYEELETYNHKGKITCVSGEIGHRGGWNPEILPNGTVILCCMDYGLEHILGNLLTQSWGEILCDAEFLAYEEGLEDERSASLCRKCPAALQIDSSNFDYGKLLGPNAIKISRIIENYRQGIVSEEELINRYSEKSANVIRLLGEENVCLYGLGRLFEENYYQSLWHNIIQANIFSDSRKELWGERIHGIKCIPPEELKGIDKLTVVTYVTNDGEIRKQLRKLGIENIINAYEIFNLCS